MKLVERLPSRYRIDGKLGEGGFGEVYKAYDSHLKQALAIKILPDKAASEQETLTKEFKTLSQLQHPNLVRVFDYGTLPPRAPYFTMELVEGENLREFLRNKSNIFLIPTLIRQTLKALAYLHKNRILHGDIKPENIVITENEDKIINTKLLDFGLTSSFGDDRKLASGTLRYLAPEILLHGDPRSPATDLYALGVSLIESILLEEVPSSDRIDEAFLKDTYIELNRTLASIGIRNPSALSSFILDLCRIDPSGRIQDTKEARQSFEMIAAELSPGQEIQMNSIFVGRSMELREIDSRLATADSAKKVVILSGARGIGKKSIIRKAAQQAQLNGLLPIDLTPSYSHFSLDQLSDTLGSHLSATERKHLLSRLSKLSSRTKSNNRKEDIDPNPERASIIYADVIQFLVDISTSKPLLIVISDIERSSDDFLLFIVQLLKQMETSETRIHLLISSNPYSATQLKGTEALNRIAKSPLSESIEVKPFNDELLKEYLTAYFGQTLLPEKERQDIISKTHGLPLLIGAFLKSLLATNVIQNEEGYWILDRRLYKQSRIPTDIGGSFSLATRGISEGGVALLRMLALSGQALKPEQLASVTRGLAEDLSRALTELMERIILAYGNDGTISFAHPLYTQIIIENTPPDVMRNYSGLLADRLVSDGSNDSLLIAKLYISAERVDEALEYGFEANKKMYSSYMLYDCLNLLLDLKDLVSRKGDKYQLLGVLDRLAPVEHKAGLPKEAIEDYSTLVGSVESDSKKADYYMQLADIHYGLLGNIEESKALLQKALRSAKRVSESDLIAAVYHMLAGLSPEKSILFYERTAALSRETNINLYLGSLAHLAYSYQLAGRPEKASTIQETLVTNMNKADVAAKKEIYFYLYCTNFYRADYKVARFYIKKKIQLEKRTEDSLRLIVSMSSLAGCFYTEGSFYKMIDTLREAFNAAMKYNNYLSAITILSNLSLGYRSVADYGLSMKMLLQAEDIIKREGIQELNTAFLNKPTMLYLMLGKAKETEFKASARRLHANGEKTRNHIAAGHHSMAFALHYLNRLKPSDALIHAKEALSHFRKAADRDDVVSALVHMAIIQISQKKPKLARTNLEHAEETFEAIHCEYLKPLLMLAKAMLARTENAEDARKTLNDALRTSKKMGTREITWQIQREFALYYKGRDELHRALSYYKDAVDTIKQITETIDEEEIRMSYLEVPFRRRVFDEIKALKRELPKTP